MGLNNHPHIRCRTNLAPYYKQRVEFVGFLKYAKSNQVTSKADRAITLDTALFIEVHGYQTIHDNPNKQQPVDIELDHVHCRLKSQDVQQYENQVVTFSARVYRYQATYKGEPETRYGLTDLLLTNRNKEAIFTVNERFATHLSQSQAILLRTILPQLTNKYRSRRLYSYNQLCQKLLKFTTIESRTSFLSHTEEKTSGGHLISTDKLDFFTSNPQDDLSNEKVAEAHEALWHHKLKLKSDQIVARDDEIESLTQRLQNLSQHIKAIEAHQWEAKYHQLATQSDTTIAQLEATIQKLKDENRGLNHRVDNYLKQHPKRTKPSVDVNVQHETVTDDQLAALKDAFKK